MKAFFAIVLVVLFSFFAFFNSARIKACEDCVNENSVEEILNSESVNDDLLDVGDEQEVNPMSSSSAPEWMKKYYKIDDGLKTTPVFGIKNLLDDVELGDIYHETNAAGGNGHVAVVTGIKYDNHYKKYYIELIENAKKYNVCYGMLDDYRFTNRGGSIYRFAGMNSEKANRMIDYLKNKLGTTYSTYNFNCAHLVRKALEHVGYSNFPEGSTFLFSPRVMPEHIISHSAATLFGINTHSCNPYGKYTSSYRSIDKVEHGKDCYCGNVIDIQCHSFRHFGKAKKCYKCGCIVPGPNTPNPEIPLTLKIKFANLFFINSSKELILPKVCDYNGKKQNYNLS